MQALARRLAPLTARLRQPLVLAAAILAVVAVVLAATLGPGSAGEDEGTGPEPGAGLGGSFENRALGVSVDFPEGWRASREGGAVRVRRVDDKALVSISPADRGESPGELLEASFAAISDNYRSVERLSRERIEISGEPATARTLVGVNEEDVRLRILLAAVESRGRSYLLNVFATKENDALLLEVESILNSLELGRG